MNLGEIWGDLDGCDKQIIIEAIHHYGRTRPNSYLNKHKHIKVNNPLLAFVKIKPVLASLILYYSMSTWYNHESKAKTTRIIELIRKAIWINEPN